MNNSSRSDDAAPDATPDTPRLWERAKDVPPFVSSIIAVIAAIGALITWTFSYFATQDQLEQARCVSYLSTLIVEKRFEIKVFADSIPDLRLRIDPLDKKEKGGTITPQELKVLVDLKTRLSEQRALISDSRERWQAAKHILRSNQLLDSNGKCKM
jgi:hypothetical protein